MGDNFGSSRLAVLVVAVALCAAAAFTLVKVLSGSGDNAASADVAAITVLIVLFGTNALAGLYLARRRRGLAAFGYLTTILTVVTVIAIVVKVFERNILLGGDFDLQGIGLTLSLAAGQISVLLAFDRAEDPPALRAATFAGVASVLALGVLAAYAVSAIGGTPPDKVYAVLATLYLLALALVALMRGAIWLEGIGGRRGTSSIA